jgi:multimeric flavodoxin WrbA
MVKILAVSGSPRRSGNTDTLLEQFVRGAEETGAEVKTMYLRNYSLNSCVGCEQCRGRGFCVRFDDGMSLFYPEIEASRGLILGSPVHNYNVTAHMKAFIDRLFPYYVFTNDNPRQFSSRLNGQGRRALVFGVGEQKSAADMRLVLPAMALPLQALGYEITRKVNFKGFLGRGVVAESEKTLEAAHKMGLTFGESLRLPIV